MTFETVWEPTKSTVQLTIKDRFKPNASNNTSRETATALNCSLMDLICNPQGSHWRNARSRATCLQPKNSKCSQLDSKHTSSNSTITQPTWHQGPRCSWQPRSPTTSKPLAVKADTSNKTLAIDTDMNNIDNKTHKIDRIVTR